MWLSYLIKYKWIIGTVAAIVSLIIAFNTMLNNREEYGYNRAVIELQGAANEAIQKATKEAVDKAAKEMQDALAKQQLVYDAQIEQAKQEQEVKIQTEKVIEYVSKIKIKNECNVISDDIISLLNNSVSNSSIASSKSP